MAPSAEIQLVPDRRDGDAAAVLTLAEVARGSVESLLASFGLQLEVVPDAAAIPGSYWGEPEAGLIGARVFSRRDTPLHSLLHEACHLIVLPPEQRVRVHTDASDSIAEEDAACYLQIILSDRIEGAARERLMRDMDTWGYSFRLGSAKAWFEQDSSDARDWLRRRGLLD